MLSCRSLPLLLVVSATLSLAQSAVEGSHERSHPATAEVLAESSSAHTSSGNEDIYVAELTLGGKKEPELAKLVDRYPGYALRIDRAALQARRHLHVRVTRDPECDVPAEEIFLPPGSKGDFDPEVRKTLQEHRGDVVPCYRLEHDATRLGNVR